MSKRVRFAESTEDGTVPKQPKLQQEQNGREGEQVYDLPEQEENEVDDADQFGEEPEELVGERKEYASKHTLDSDEEIDEKHKKLDVKKVDFGQEKPTIEFDGETKITPFNMDDELEEGHFDAMGNYVFDKPDEMLKDAWLDNIDWGRIKKDAGGEWVGGATDETDPEKEKNLDENDDNDEKPPQSQMDTATKLDICQKLRSYLKPKESVTAALKRLGGNKSASELRKMRWANKKAKADGKAVLDESDLVANGEFDAYSYTAEKLDFELQKHQKNSELSDEAMDDGQSAACSSSTAVSDTNSDVKRNPEKKVAKGADGEKEVNTAGPTWEFKWENSPDAEIHGPCSTMQMLHWKTSGYFGENGVLARKCGSQGAFYSTERVDFELYLEDD